MYSSSEKRLNNEIQLFNRLPASPNNRFHSSNNVLMRSDKASQNKRTIVDDLQNLDTIGNVGGQLENDESQDDSSIFERGDSKEIQRRQDISIINLTENNELLKSKKLEWEAQNSIMSNKKQIREQESSPDYQSKYRLDTDIENPTEQFLRSVQGRFDINNTSMDNDKSNNSQEAPVNAFLANLKYGSTDLELIKYKKPLDKKPKTTRTDMIIYDTSDRNNHIISPPPLIPQIPRLNTNQSTNLKYENREQISSTKYIADSISKPYIIPETTYQVTKTITESRDENYPLDASLFKFQRANPYMENLLLPDTYVLKKKANYIERLSCSICPEDNCYKLYEWQEKQVQKGIRLMKFKQTAPECVRIFCCSHYRSYRTIGKSSNRKKHLTKSIRTFRWMCPCNVRKPITAVFDVYSGYLGKIEQVSSLECIFFCKNLKLKLYDYLERYIYKLVFPALNMISVFGLYPWESHERYDFRIINKITGETTAIIRKQWSYFCKDKCSNGGHYFIKFIQNPIPWNHKLLIMEALMMIDMSHYNNRCSQSMEMCAIMIFIFLAIIVLIFYGIFMSITYE